MVATIFRIRDAITTLFCHSNKIPFQQRHHTSKSQLQVNKTSVHSCKIAKSSEHTPNASKNSHTILSKVNNYNPKFISNFNCHTNYLLKINTISAPQIQSQNLKLNSTTKTSNKVNHITMSANESAQNNLSSSPQTPRVTFRAKSTSNTNTSASINNTQAFSSPEHRDIELSREKIFENNLNQLFAKSLLAVLSSKDAVLKEIRDCVMQDDEARCKEVSHYIHFFWKDLHVKSGCLCVDERVAILNSIKDAVLESIHMTHPGSWGMISLSQYAWWSSMHREIFAKSSDCVPCTDIGKNLKPIIPKSQWHPH